jgi:hypothetical protein
MKPKGCSPANRNEKTNFEVTIESDSIREDGGSGDRGEIYVAGLSKQKR